MPLRHRQTKGAENRHVTQPNVTRATLRLYRLPAGRFAQIAAMSGRRPVVKGCFEAVVNVSSAVMSTAC